MGGNKGSLEGRAWGWLGFQAQVSQGGWREAEVEEQGWRKGQWIIHGL